jgi:hypothetical protein
VNSRTFSTGGFITRCCDREVAVLSHLARIKKKPSEQSLLDSFDTRLFITEIKKLPVIWDLKSSFYNNKQKEN